MRIKKYIAFFLGVAFLVGTASISTAQEEPDDVDLQFYASPIQVVKKEAIRLEWESEGAEYCTADGAWSGRKDTAGSAILKAKKTGVYTLQCFDEDGSASKKISQKVTVVASKKKLKRKKLQKPTPALTAPSYANDDEEVVIEWKAPQGTVACRASGPDDWAGLKAPSGSLSVSAEIGKEYALSCWNQNGEKGALRTIIFEKKPNAYSAAAVGLSSDYLPLYPDDFTLADDRTVYFIDFVRKEEYSADTDDDDVFFWGTRIVIDPDTNGRIEERTVLSQLNALPGQVPPDVDPATKRISVTGPLSFIPEHNSYKYAHDDLNRFVNDGEYSMKGQIPTLTLDATRALATQHVLVYLGLPKDDEYHLKSYRASMVAIWFNGLTAGVPMYYALDVFNSSDEKIRTIIIDPYTGEDYTSKGLFSDGVWWDRTVLKAREKISQETPALEKGNQPIANPPTQNPVAPITESKKEEPKKEEQKVSTCSAGFIWSPTLGQCYEDTSAKQDSAAQTTCPAGYSYSVTLKQCVY